MKYFSFSENLLCILSFFLLGVGIELLDKCIRSLVHFLKGVLTIFVSKTISAANLHINFEYKFKFRHRFLSHAYDFFLFLFGGILYFLMSYYHLDGVVRVYTLFFFLLGFFISGFASVYLKLLLDKVLFIVSFLFEKTIGLVFALTLRPICILIRRLIGLLLIPIKKIPFEKVKVKFKSIKGIFKHRKITKT